MPVNSNQFFQYRFMSHLKSAIYVSSVFLLFQAIVNTEIGILSQFTHQHGNSWVGPLANALLFLGSGLFAPINFYIGRYAYNKILFLSGISYLGYIGMIILFLQIGFSTLVEIAILIVSFICGVILSALYNGQYNYINACSQLDKEPSKYFGINLTIVQSANILGNFISAFLITPLGQELYSIVMAFAFLLVCCLFMFVKNVKYTDLPLENDQEQFDNNIIEKQNSKSTISQSFIQQSSAYSLVFCYILSGFCISFVYSSFSVIMYKTFDDKDQIQLNRITFNIFIYEGVGQLLGGIIVACFSNKIKSQAAFFTIVGNIFLISLALIYIGSQNKSLLMMTIGFFFVGIADSTTFSTALSISGKWHQKGISAFVVNQCTFFAVASLIFYFGGFQIFIVVTVLVHILAIVQLTFSKVIK